jgi:hypothetical protein
MVDRPVIMLAAGTPVETALTVDRRARIETQSRRLPSRAWNFELPQVFVLER